MFKNITTVSFLVLFLLFHAGIGAASEQKLLEDIRFDTLSETEERITFQLNGAYIPKIFAIKGERPRVVFDFPDIRPARLLKNRFNTNGKFIKRIRIGIHYKPDAKTRVVFDLMPDQEVDFKQDFDKQKNRLIITVYHAGSEPADRPEVQEAQKQKQAQPEPPVQAEEKPRVSESGEPALPGNQLKPEKQETAPSPALPVPEQSLSRPAESVEPAPPEPSQTKPSQVEQPVPPEPVQAKTSQVEPVPPPPVQEEPGQAEPEKSQPIELQPERTQPEPAPAAPGTVEQPPAAKPAPDQPAESQTILSSITFDNSTNRGEMVLFQLNEFHSPIVFGIEEGEPRVVCDFKNTAAGTELPAVITTDGKYVHSIRIGLETTPQKVRVVLDLAPHYRYDLQQVFFKDNNTFAIIINTLHNKTKPKSSTGPDRSN